MMISSTTRSGNLVHPIKRHFAVFSLMDFPVGLLSQKRTQRPAYQLLIIDYKNVSWHRYVWFRDKAEAGGCTRAIPGIVFLGRNYGSGGSSGTGNSGTGNSYKEEGRAGGVSMRRAHLFSCVNNPIASLTSWNCYFLRRIGVPDEIISLAFSIVASPEFSPEATLLCLLALCTKR